MQVPDEIKTRYFERRKRDVEECCRRLKAGDFQFIEKVGHQLRGNGVTFGYPELSIIGQEMEKAARTEDSVFTDWAILKFKDWVKVHLS